MPEVKMTARSPRAVSRDDIVVQTAIRLGITPEELFKRAYSSAGNASMDGEGIFTSHYYPGNGTKKFHIPIVVQNYCKAGIVCCSCGATEPKDAKKMFSRIAGDSSVTYFCSMDCMNAGPKQIEPSKRRGRPKQEGDADGKRIFRDISLAVSKAKLVMVPESKIRFMPNQPRKHFDQTKLQGLANSMLQLRGSTDDPEVTGQIMPGFIRGIPEDADGCEYELLDGERRLRSVRIAGIEYYRAMLIEIDDEGARHVISIIANFNREGHTVLEMADAVYHLHVELGFTFMEIVDVIDKNYNQVLDFFRLRNLIPEVRDMLDPDKVSSKKKMLTQGAAFEIAKLPARQQLGYAKRSVEEGLRVADLKQQVRETRSYNGGGTRTISPSERRNALVGAIRRLPTTVSALETAARLAESSDATSMLSEEERLELHTALLECRGKIDSVLAIVEPPNVPVS